MVDDPAGLRCGIEAEFALVHTERGFCDFSSPTFAEAQRIVDRLPDHGDPDLTRGDLAVKVTRWYVEGDERFDAAGAFLGCVPKGLETRTPVRPSIAAAVHQLSGQTAQLAAAARIDGFRLAAVGRVKQTAAGLRLLLGQEDLIADDDLSGPVDHLAELLDAGVADRFPFLRGARAQDILWGVDRTENLPAVTTHGPGLISVTCGSAVRACIPIGERAAAAVAGLVKHDPPPVT